MPVALQIAGLLLVVAAAYKIAGDGVALLVAGALLVLVGTLLERERKA